MRVCVLLGGLLLGCSSTPPRGVIDASTGSGDASGMFDSTELLASCLAYAHDCTSGASEPHCGECQYRIRFDRQRCTSTQPCDNLFLLWSAAGCDGASIQATLDLALATRPNWLAACAQPLYPGEMLPTTLGAPDRENAVMAALLGALRTDPDAGVWSGRNVLMAGCSAGATRYPIVAARTTDDATWLGTGKNAACFSDGVFSIPFQDAFTGEGLLGGGTSCEARHRRVAEAYTVAGAVADHACSASPQGQCACDPAHASRTWTGTCGNGNCLDFDSIVVQGTNGFVFANGVNAASFAVPHWKLVSEGSNFAATADRCSKDVVPEAPLAGLCQQLDADPARTCSLVTFPSTPHCSAFRQNLATECVDWFETL